MVNTYFKHLNVALNDSSKSEFIKNIQRDLTNSARILNENAEELTAVFSQNELNKSLDINSLLKYYLLNQILKTETVVKKAIEEVYQKTANPNIFKKIDTNEYYWLKNGEYELDENLENVNEDGSYNKINKISTSSYKIRYSYSVDNKKLSFQLLNPNDVVVNNKWQIVELLDLRKELVNRYKYSGFSGNSYDIIASLLNKLNPPVESGLYMDKHYNLLKWNAATSKFLLVANSNATSPLLTDYSFENRGVVVKKEYTGIR